VTSREDKFRKRRYLALDERCKKHNYIAIYAERTRNKERPERLKKNSGKSKTNITRMFGVFY